MALWKIHSSSYKRSEYIKVLKTGTFLCCLFSTLTNPFVQPMRRLFYGLSAVLWALMSYQRKPIMEQYSCFMGCALRSVTGPIPSRSKNYYCSTLATLLQRETTASSLWQGLQCAADLDCTLVPAVCPGKDIRVFHVADRVDFYIVELCKDQFNTYLTTLEWWIIERCSLAVTGWLSMYWVISMMVDGGLRHLVQLLFP